MRKKLLFCFCITLLITTGAVAQNGAVTNFDLEKYRNERIKAETELRENYAQLGFPSPEERARRDAESAKQAGELSLKLRDQRIEQERIDADRQNAELLAATYARSQQQVQTVYQEPYYWGGYWSYGVWRPRYIRQRPIVQPLGHFAGGHYWPSGTPAATPTRQPVRSFGAGPRTRR